MKTTPRQAFTLLELLVVMAIMALLTGLAVPGIAHTVKSTRLSASGQMLVDELNLARQTAMSRNIQVEVRLYQLPDHNQPINASPSSYRALQSFLVSGDTVQPVEKAEFFPAPIIIAPDQRSSALIHSTEHPLLTPAPGSTLSEYGVNYRYRAFRFSPGGAADLSSDEAHLTLVVQNDKPLSEGANFYTIQINPINGSIRTFRP